MKKTLLTALMVLFAVAAFAQKGSVTATLVDADTGDEVIGAVLTLTPSATPDKKQYATSAYKGLISFPSLSYGEYGLSISFLGYNTLDTTFRVSAPKVNLGVLRLKPGVQIETVVKEVKSMRTSQKGDTVSYNAGAFKVTTDADVEGLLKKMPGITVTDGTVEAQGEEIKKIFVDGKEFIDRKLMEEQKAGGLTRKLVGFKMIDRGIPRHGYQIASPEGDIIGQVTSGTMSPCLKQGIGMGYVKKEFAKVGTQIAIVIREKLIKAEVVKLPFIQQK